MKDQSVLDTPDIVAKGKLRVLACGGRGFTDREALDCALDALHAACPIVFLIHGGADGADSLAGAWADQRGVPVNVFPADWDAHGRAAGPMRNEQMLTEGQPDLVVAFPGGYGTSHMIRLARQAGVPVWKPIPFEETPPKKWELRGLSEPDHTYVCRSEADICSTCPP